MELVWITDAVYDGDYRLLLTFNDGRQGLVDLENYTCRSPFEPLRDSTVFRNFQLNGWTVSWLDGSIDIAPESLYAQMNSGLSR
ncbi:MAG: DUF2442 domain-containing protein [Bacteroidales bacterium]|nr:DUF2442 domain-containing protein [Bacteroidales bacterium]